MTISWTIIYYNEMETLLDSTDQKWCQSRGSAKKLKSSKNFSTAKEIDNRH